MGVFGLARLSLSSFRLSLETDLNRLSRRLMLLGNPQDPDDQAGSLLLLVPEKLRRMAEDGTWKPAAIKTAGGLAAVTVVSCGLCPQESAALTATPTAESSRRLLVIEDDLQAHKRAPLYAEMAPDIVAVLPAHAPYVGAPVVSHKKTGSDPRPKRQHRGLQCIKPPRKNYRARHCAHFKR